MPGTDYRVGMPMGATPVQSFSRSAEFTGGQNGGGTNHTVMGTLPHELTSTPYQPTSVLAPYQGSKNGMSDTTYSANSALSYGRSY